MTRIIKNYQKKFLLLSGSLGFLSLPPCSVQGVEISSEGQTAQLEDYVPPAQKVIQQTIQVMDKLDAYLQELGTEKGQVQETLHPQLFTQDFQMIIDGKTVVPDLAHLAGHLQHIKAQTRSIKFSLYRRVFAPNLCVMHYDFVATSLTGEEKTIRVMAIFDIREGKVSKMTEVTHPLGEGRTIDYRSK